jgi:hypothetical protein
MDRFSPEIDRNGKWYPNGLYIACGYYGGSGAPETRRDTEGEMADLCRLLNAAYNQGRSENARDIRKAIGL